MKTIHVPYKKHIQPDTTAQIFWLKNRQPDRWRDQTHTNMSGELDISAKSDKQIRDELESLRA